MTNGDELELVRKREDTEQLELRHRRPEVLVVRRHRAIRHIVVRRDTAQLCALEAASGTLVLDEVALLEKRGSGVHDVCPLLDKRRITLKIVDANAVQDWVLEHTNVAERCEMSAELK